MEENKVAPEVLPAEGQRPDSRERRDATFRHDADPRPWFFVNPAELLDSDESDDEWKEKGCNRWRKDTAVHAFVRTVSESFVFNCLILTAVIANTVVLALELNYKDEWDMDWVTETAEPIFIAIYSIEFVVKVYAEPQLYWTSGWNIFDFLILSVCYIQLIISGQDNKSINFAGSLTGLKTLKALRALRALRAVSFIRGLQVIFIALFDTMKKSFVNVMLILIFITYLFSILGVNLFWYYRPPNSDNNVELKQSWSNGFVAFGTLWTYVTVDGWYDEYKRLITTFSDPDYSAWKVFIIFFTIVFILLAHFLIFNIMIGMNIMNIQEANENYHEQIIAEKESILARKKELILHRQHEDVRKLKEKQVERDCSDFYDMVKSFESNLKSDDYVIQDSLVTDPVWIEIYLQTLLHMYERTQEIRQFHVELTDIFKESLNREIEKRL